MLKFLGSLSDPSQCVNVSIAADNALEDEWMFFTSASGSTAIDEEDNS